jgi:molybdopterin molybdotransferase
VHQDHEHKEFKSTIDVETALKKFFSKLSLKPQGTEKVSISEAVGRILAVDVISTKNIPEHRKSAMDGYAVKASDTFGASSTNPITVSVEGRVSMGKVFQNVVERGQAVEITTGGILPEGADSVVMKEHARRLDDKFVELLTSVSPGKNVSRVGEDIEAGQTVMRAGTRLQAPHIGVLASLSLQTVMVRKPPLFGVLSTGDELRDPFDPPRNGSTIDVNRIMLSTKLRQLGAEVLDLGIAPDDREIIRVKAAEALSACDALIVTGGTSVSDIDLVPEIVDSIGEPGIIVHGVSIRPAHPTGLGVVNGKPVVLLSGFPVSALIGFDLFVEPLIMKMLNTQSLPKTIIVAKAARKIPHSTGLRTFVRVRVTQKAGGYSVEPLMSTGSSVLTSLTNSNGIVVIPENVEGYDVDQPVNVIVTGPIEWVGDA